MKAEKKKLIKFGIMIQNTNMNKLEVKSEMK